MIIKTSPHFILRPLLITLCLTLLFCMWSLSASAQDLTGRLDGTLDGSDVFKELIENSAIDPDAARDRAVDQISEIADFSPSASESLIDAILENEKILDLENLEAGIEIAGDLIDGFKDDANLTMEDLPKVLEILDNVNLSDATPEAVQKLLGYTINDFVSLDVAEAISTISDLGNIDSLQDILENDAVKEELAKFFAGFAIDEAPTRVAEILSAIGFTGLSADAFGDLSTEAIAQAFSDSLAASFPDLFGSITLALSAEEFVATLSQTLLGSFGGGYTIPVGATGKYEIFPRDAKARGVIKFCIGACTATCLCRGAIVGNHITIRSHVTDEFIRHRTWMIDEFMANHILPAMGLMTAQLSAVSMNHLYTIGRFFDAKHQMETERIFQNLMAEAHRDYQPSAGLCEVGTNVRDLAMSEATSNLTQTILTDRMNARTRRNGDVLSAMDMISDDLSRIEQYKNVYCNVNDNSKGLDVFCGDVERNKNRLNKDINITQTLYDKQTLELDLKLVDPIVDPEAPPPWTVPPRPTAEAPSVDEWEDRPDRERPTPPPYERPPGATFTPYDDGTLKAFPGAAGFGSATVGGRGGQVVYVTSLRDSGPGTLRDALTNVKGPRTILFDVEGEIELNTQIDINSPFVTIAGQSAPGDGVVITGARLRIQTNDVIVRGLKIRPGDALSGGKPDDRDAISIGNGGRNVIIDGNSFSWAIDETVAVWGATSNITISNNIIAESLNNSLHSKGAHGKALIIGNKAGEPNSQNISVFGNALISNLGRNPFMKQVGNEDGTNGVEFVNNYITNYGAAHQGGHFGGGDDQIIAAVVNNYYEDGRDTNSREPRPVFDIRSTEEDSAILLDGNYVEGHSEGNQAHGKTRFLVGDPQFNTNYNFQGTFGDDFAGALSASVVKDATLSTAGARINGRLDCVDARIINEAAAGTTEIIDRSSQVGGLSCYNFNGDRVQDTDGDGLPDWFERQYADEGFDYQTADANGDLDGDGYSNLEEYLNGLVTGFDFDGSNSSDDPATEDEAEEEPTTDTETNPETDTDTETDADEETNIDTEVETPPTEPRPNPEPTTPTDPGAAFEEENFDREDIMALSANLFSHELNPVIARLQLATPEGRVRSDALTYMDLRSVMAKRSVAENTFAAIVAERAAGQERVSPSFLKRIVADLGIPEDEVHEILGINPSYYAQRKVLTSYAYENPKFYTELYESAANVARKDTALKALNLMLEDDFYDRQLESEATLAIMLEVMLEKQHTRASAELSILDPEDQ